MGLGNFIEKKVHLSNNLKSNNDDNEDLTNPNLGISAILGIKTVNNYDISAYQVKPDMDSGKFIVISHGNGDNISAWEFKSFCKNLANQCECTVIAYSYIGYGQSEKLNPSEQHCIASLDAVMTYLLKDISPTKIFLFGRSLGTGVTVIWAAKNKWKTPIILVSPYKSICTVVIDTIIVKPFDKYNALAAIKKLDCPVKIFHGDNDDVINISHGRTMYSALKNKRFQPEWFRGIGHNNILNKIVTEYGLLDDVINYEIEN